MDFDLATVDWTAIAAVMTGLAAIFTFFAALQAAKGVKVAARGIDLAEGAVNIAESASRLDRRTYLDNLYANVRNAYHELQLAFWIFMPSEEIKGSQSEEEKRLRSKEIRYSDSETYLRYHRALNNLELTIELLNLSGIGEIEVDGNRTKIDICLQAFYRCAWFQYLSLMAEDYIEYSNAHEMLEFLKSQDTRIRLDREVESAIQAWIDLSGEKYQEAGMKMDSSSMFVPLFEFIVMDLTDDFLRVVEKEANWRPQTS